MMARRTTARKTLITQYVPKMISFRECNCIYLSVFSCITRHSMKHGSWSSIRTANIDVPLSKLEVLDFEKHIKLTFNLLHVQQIPMRISLREKLLCQKFMCLRSIYFG